MSIPKITRAAMLTASVALVPTGFVGGLVPDAAASDGAVPMLERGIRLEVFIDESAHLSFEHPTPDGGQAYVRVDQGQVRVGLSADTVTLQEAAAWEDLGVDVVSVLLMDIDFDGYLDVGVLDGIGYGGVNLFWRFHRADPDGTFSPVSGTVSNPERDDLMGTIISSSRSGPFWSRDVHRVDNDRFRLMLSREARGEYDVVTFPAAGKGGDPVRGIIPAIAPDPWDGEALEDPAFHQFAIATNPGRSYFYDEPEESTRRGAYLVEGDVGRVTGVSAWGEWFHVVFTHADTHITTTGWMRGEDLVLPQG